MQHGIKLKAFQFIHNNRYRIVRHIADGGEGYVYLAQDTVQGNNICIIKQMFHSADDLEGIENDYQQFSNLYHPNIVQVMDYFWDNNVFYIVMNFIPGETMSSYLHRLSEPVPELTALGWMAKLANILDFLHNRPSPIIHADIAPDNIMITQYNDLIIIDFGIARSVFEAIGIREGYSAPEQVKQGLLSPSTDVFSLGATIFKCLCLVDLPEPSFDIRNINPNIHKSTAELLMKATHPKPTGLFGLMKGRYTNMQELIQSLNHNWSSMNLR